MRIKNFILAVTLCSVLLIAGCGTSDVVDQVANITNKSEPIVQMVKNGNPTAYPNVTYEEAFEDFFASPTWKYFVGSQEDSEAEEDVVEFTGYCSYQNVEVKALIQFTVDVDNGTFDATYLSFNDVPQDMLTLGVLLETAFDSYYNNSDVSTDDYADDTSNIDTAENDTTYEAADDYESDYEFNESDFIMRDGCAFGKEYYSDITGDTVSYVEEEDGPRYELIAQAVRDYYGPGNYMINIESIYNGGGGAQISAVTLNTSIYEYKSGQDVWENWLGAADITFVMNYSDGQWRFMELEPLDVGW